MTLPARFLSRTTAAAVATLAIVLALATPSPAAKGKVYYLDYNGGASQHPNSVFFTANSGPRLLEIQWKDWGAKRTVGNGTFYNNCVCPLDYSGPGKLVLRRPVTCRPEYGTYEGRKIRVYRRGKLHYPDGEGGMETSNVGGGYAVCK